MQTRQQLSLPSGKRQHLPAPLCSPLMLSYFWKIALLLLFSVAPLCAGDDFSFDDDSFSSPTATPVRLELYGEDLSIQPGRPFWVALHVDIDDHWHAYWKHPGDIGMPLRLEWKLPEGYEVSELQWPFPLRFEKEGFVGYGFENSITLLAEISPPATAIPGSKALLEANIRWLVCSDMSCLPGETTLSLELPLSTAAPALNQERKDFFSSSRRQLPQMQSATTASINNGFIDLQTQAPSGKKLTSAYFCPLDKSTIDTKAEAPLTAISAQPGFYNLRLKVHEKNSSSALRGVLVMEADGDKEAIDINVPLERDSLEISMADSQARLSIGAGSSYAATSKPPLAAMEFDGGFALALLFAFMGGAILNLMPCVLPVVSFKVLSFVKMAGQSRSLILKHGLAFSAGVLVSFWVLAGLMLALQAYGQSVGWGFQLQEPIFVAALASLLLLLALNLFGVFEMGTSITGWAGQADSHSHASALIGSFFSGVLATAVATPCTGPFLGSAIAFAVTLPAFWALLIFTALGLGMASPYLLLTAFPSLLRFVPKPGNWMNTFKEVLGFIMLATVLWLVWVFAAQTNTLAIFMLLTAFFILSIGAWIYGRWGSILSGKNTRIVGIILAFGCLGLAGYTIGMATSPFVLESTDAHVAGPDSEGWEVFSPDRIAELQAAGTPVLVDFTAKWCLICQANHIVLSTDLVEKAMQKKGVVKMKADWTKNDAVITKALKQLGRNGVPLYVLYGSDLADSPIILPQVLTPSIVVDHIDQLTPSVASK